MPQVRLRGIKYALEGSIDRPKKALERYRLVPEKWTDVSDEVADFLKSRFGDARERDTVTASSWDTTPGTPSVHETRAEDPINNPHGQYIIEFRSGKEK